METKLISRIALAGMSLAALCASAGETRAWWHFNAPPGTPVGSYSDAAAVYTLSVCTNATSRFDPVATEAAPVATAARSCAFLKDEDGVLTFLDDDVSGALPVNRPDPDDPTKVLSATLVLSADQVKGLLPIYEDRTGAEQYSIKSFTCEFVVRREKDSTDLTFDLVQMMGSADQLFTLSVVSDGTGSIRVDRSKYGDYHWSDVSAQRTSKAILPRDGKWHHIAITYDDNGSGKAGRIRIYGDYACVLDVTLVEDTRKAGYEGVVKLRRASYGDFSKYGNMYVSLLDKPASAAANLVSIDEFRVSDGALQPEEMLHIASRKPVEFLFPLNAMDGAGKWMSAADTVSAYAADVTVPNVAITAYNRVGAKSLVPNATFADRGKLYSCHWGARFDKSSGVPYFQLSPDVLTTMGADDFTLEAFVNVASAETQTIFARGTEWALNAEGGNLVWRHGSAVATLQKVNDGAWHHVALVYSAAEPAFNVYVDGLSAGEIADATKLVGEDPVSGLFVGNSSAAGANALVGGIFGLRGTPSALSPGRFLTRMTPSGDSTEVVHWTLDAPGHVGEYVGKADSFPSTLDCTAGDSEYRLQGGYYTNYRAGFVQSGETCAAWPQIVSEVPCAYTWDAASGRIVNPENTTSVFFTRTTYQLGTALRTVGPAHFAASNITVECFARARPDPHSGGLVSMLCGGEWSTSAWSLSYQYGASLYAGFRFNQYNQQFAKTANQYTRADAWRHLAFQLDGSSQTQTVVKVFYDYDLSEELVYAGPIWMESDTVDKIIHIGYGHGLSDNLPAPFHGEIDEPRIHIGKVEPAHFMRKFVPRDDLRGIWLADGCKGAELYSPELSYLTGTFGADVTASTVLPYKETRLAIPGRGRVDLSESAYFDSGLGITIPCAATVGCTDFTVEASVCGAGEIVSKARMGGRTWGIRTNEKGQAEMFFDQFAPGTVNDGLQTLCGTPAEGTGVVADESWHHVAMTVKRTPGGTATAKLYVDRELVSTVSVPKWYLDGGDLTVGRGFSGNMLALRFSPTEVSASDFLVPVEKKGLAIIVR